MDDSLDDRRVEVRVLACRPVDPVDSLLKFTAIPLPVAPSRTNWLRSTSQGARPSVVTPTRLKAVCLSSFLDQSNQTVRRILRNSCTPMVTSLV